MPIIRAQCPFERKITKLPDIRRALEMHPHLRIEENGRVLMMLGGKLACTEKRCPDNRQLECGREKNEEKED